MNEHDVVDLIDKLRTRWTADLPDHEHLAWRTELALVTHEAARQTLTNLYLRRPHHRPTITEFLDELQTITNPTRLPDHQIERNLEGLARMRAAWNNRHLDQQETTTA